MYVPQAKLKNTACTWDIILYSAAYFQCKMCLTIVALLFYSQANYKELNNCHYKRCFLQLRPNPAKTQVAAFHLRNKDATRKLNVVWQDVQLEFTNSPKYLGVTLDRTLSYKQHCVNTGMKISARNNILRKLVGSSWGANPHTLKVSATALCYSAAEYACPVWHRSAHVRHVDTALNESCRIITGCLKPAPVSKVRVLAGIAPPHIRRSVAARSERSTQATDNRHPMYGYQPTASRLKSRKSFIATTTPLTTPPETERVNLWRAESGPAIQGEWFQPSETFPPGAELQYPTWKALNRLRTGVGRTKDNLVKWKIATDVKCSCGEEQIDR